VALEAAAATVLYPAAGRRITPVGRDARVGCEATSRTERTPPGAAAAGSAGPARCAAGERGLEAGPQEAAGLRLRAMHGLPAAGRRSGVGGVPRGTARGQ